jgi:DNA-binding NarL/FixJ family response regulator
MTSRRASILVATPARLKAEALTEALSAMAHVVGVVPSSREELMASVRRVRPDILLMDASVAGDRVPSGDLRAAVQVISPATRIVRLVDRGSSSHTTSFPRPADDLTFDVGASLPELTEMLRLVGTVDHPPVFSPTGCRSDVVQALADPVGSPRRPPALTPREREVLLLLTDGLDNVGIAERLGVSPHTARTHIRNILRKLGVHTRLDAVLAAFERGLAREPA